MKNGVLHIFCKKNEIFYMKIQCRKTLMRYFFPPNAGMKLSARINPRRSRRTVRRLFVQKKRAYLLAFLRAVAEYFKYFHLYS